MKKYIILLFGILLTASLSEAGTPPSYRVANWYGFKDCAITFTFDDLTPNQLPIAMPLFDSYDFKMTFYPILSWNPDWNKLKTAVLNGHEVGSHTITHPNLANETDTFKLISEIRDSQKKINSELTQQLCNTIAYPYCAVNATVKGVVKDTYIGARICSGQVEQATPADFYAVSSISCGKLGLNTAQALNDKAAEAKSRNGWCVFLLHGVNDDGGYSPIQDTVLRAHLDYLKSENSSYWVATFSQVLKYIRERDALIISEIQVSPRKIVVTMEDSLPDKLYDVPLSVKRVLPAKWKSAAVFRNGVRLKSEMITEQGKQYICFNFIPDNQYINIIKN